MDPSAMSYLVALTASARSILGDALVGMFPHGSLMLGGWRPDRSDVDALVVVAAPLSPAEKSVLAGAWSEDSLRCPGAGLELSVVTEASAAAPVARPAFELHVTTAVHDRKVVDGLGHPGDPDLVLHFAVCHGLGYVPFAEVPPELVVARLADELTWATEHAASEYTVLNACRAWRYVSDGSLVSKLDGGRWAAQRLTGAELALVRTALAAQSGEGEGPDAAAARAFALHVRDVIRPGRLDDQDV